MTTEDSGPQGKCSKSGVQRQDHKESVLKVESSDRDWFSVARFAGGVLKTSACCLQISAPAIADDTIRWDRWRGSSSNSSGDSEIAVYNKVKYGDCDWLGVASTRRRCAHRSACFWVFAVEVSAGCRSERTWHEVVPAFCSDRRSRRMAQEAAAAARAATLPVRRAQQVGGSIWRYQVGIALCPALGLSWPHQGSECDFKSRAMGSLLCSLLVSAACE